MSRKERVKVAPCTCCHYTFTAKPVCDWCVGARCNQQDACQRKIPPVPGA